MRSLLFFCSCLFMSVLQAQPSHRSGLIFDDSLYLQVPSQSQLISIGSGAKSQSTSIDLSKYCPSVQDQGDLSSCVGWAAGYAALTIEHSVNSDALSKEEIDDRAFSAMFVYNLLAKGDCQGVRLPVALEVLKQYGNCRSQDFDLGIDDCSTPIPDHLLEQAAQSKIADYIRLVDPDEAASQKTRKVKQLLAQHKPVIVGMNVLNNFYNIEYGDDSWIPTVGDQTYAGGHAMVVVGYDDNRFDREGLSIPANMRGGFKLMNSWGEEWGDRGFIWVRYAHFGDYCRHAFALAIDDSPLLQTSPEPTKDLRSTVLAGTFALKTYTGVWHEGKPVFKPVEVDYQEEVYTLSRRQIGERYILGVDRSDQSYFYLFSVDPHGKAEIHYPKPNQPLDQKPNLVLPTLPGTTFELKKTGEDYLIALFSDQPLASSYLDKLSRVLSKSQNISKDLRRALETHQVSPRDLEYSNDAMSFRATSNAERRIVPVMLKIEVVE